MGGGRSYWKLIVRLAITLLFHSPCVASAVLPCLACRNSDVLAVCADWDLLNSFLPLLAFRRRILSSTTMCLVFWRCPSTWGRVMAKCSSTSVSIWKSYGKIFQQCLWNEANPLSSRVQLLSLYCIPSLTFEKQRNAQLSQIRFLQTKLVHSVSVPLTPRRAVEHTLLHVCFSGAIQGRVVTDMWVQKWPIKRRAFKIVHIQVLLLPFRETYANKTCTVVSCGSFQMCLRPYWCKSAVFPGLNYNCSPLNRL